MSRVLDCPKCSQPVTVSDDLIGRVMACPHCAAHFTVPAADAQPVSVATPISNFPHSMHMVRFTFSCMRCASILEGRGDLSGQRGRCPTCGAVFVVPRVDPATGLALDAAQVADDGQLPTPMHAYATAGTKAPEIRQIGDDELVIICPRCNRQCDIESNACPSCGTPFTMDGAEAIARTGGEYNSIASSAITCACLGMCIPGVGLLGAGLGFAAMRRADEMGTARPGYNMGVAALIVGLLTTAFWGVQIF